MKTKSLAVVVGLTLALAHGALAMTTWQGNYTSVLTATITYATHGIASGMIGVVCVDSTGAKLGLDKVGSVVDQNTYQVNITFFHSFTGTVKLSGPWPSSDTSNTTDFKVTIGTANASNLWTCVQCGTYIARRTVGTSTYTANAGECLAWLDTSVSQTVFVWLAGNQAVYGLSEGTCSQSQWTKGPPVVCGVSGIPTGAVSLASATMVNGIFTSVTDLRPW